MLYSKSLESSLSKELFKNPTKEYRGTPFWSWNTKITKKQIENTLSELKEMGMGGAHIHCRTGMNVPYLSDEFMNLVKYSHKVANENDMLTWLYDEDRWPSGFAGGLVTKDKQYRMRFLVFSPIELPEKELDGEVELEASAKAIRSGKRKFLAKYAVLLEDGFLKEYQILDRNQDADNGFDVWYAYLEISGDSAWFNNQAYLNTMDKSAVEQFIKVTHEAYDKAVGEHFGDTIPSIFTDEPQLSTKTMLGYANEKTTLTIPYTDDFEETFQNTYGDSFLGHLPEIFWDLPNNQVSIHRYHYHDHTCERFSSAFAGTIGEWCKEHNLMLIGHMMQEPTLFSQTSALGEAMRSYPHFGIPGIDMLCDRRELTTAKQAQSAAHQYGRPGVLSELYGVTNWDFDFRGHKLAGDWQAALGITVRVHHLTWTSMAGEAKRDYPAAIGYQSPWYKEYSFIENYFARLNTALTRGKADVKVGVIHPIESYWLYWGTKEHTDGIRGEMDANFIQLTKWLLYGLIDFDFIAESLLPDLQNVEMSADSSDVLDTFVESSNQFMVGDMAYDVIVVPNLVTLRKSTLDRLKAFTKKGGKVIFSGNIPNHVDAILSDEVIAYSKECTTISFNQHELLTCLSPYRTVEVRNQNGNRVDNILYQMRKDKVGRWLFLSHSEKPNNPDLPTKEILTIWIDGIYKPTKYNALTGEVFFSTCEYKNGRTYLTEEVYDHDSLLYFLEKVEDEKVGSVNGCESQMMHNTKVNMENTKITINKNTYNYNTTKTITYPSKLMADLSEPNVYPLDMAEYRFDQGEWNPQEEILRIDNLFREKLKFPLRTEAFAQPWLSTDVEPILHTLSLRFHIYSECEIIKPSLALENAEETKITWNGVAVPSIITGWYTDRDIQTIQLPTVKEGNNILEVTLPFYSKFNVEYMFLLGDFSVSVAGRNLVIQKPHKELAFGDLCSQGLPFYGGNVTYHIPVEMDDDSELNIQIPQFRCPVIKVALDNVDKGYIAFSPYLLNLGKVSKGKHIISVTTYGNRINTFGTIHNCNHTEHWIGPNAWRTTGHSWAYEYQLTKSGILVSPVITALL
jgi:hypothetical protein